MFNCKPVTVYTVIKPMQRMQHSDVISTSQFDLKRHISQRKKANLDPNEIVCLLIISFHMSVHQSNG